MPGTESQTVSSAEPPRTVREAREELPQLLASDRPILVGQPGREQGVILSCRGLEALQHRAVWAATTFAALLTHSRQPSTELAADMALYIVGELSVHDLQHRAAQRTGAVT